MTKEANLEGPILLPTEEDLPCLAKPITPVEEIMNRSTITGPIDIGRNPGVVTVTFLAPIEYLEKVKLAKYVMEKYQ